MDIEKTDLSQISLGCPNVMIDLVIQMQGHNFLIIHMAITQYYTKSHYKTYCDPQ